MELHTSKGRRERDSKRLTETMETGETIETNGDVQRSMPYSGKFSLVQIFVYQTEKPSE